MGEACRAEAYLRHLQAVSHLHQAVAIGDLEVVQTKLAVAAMFFRPHDGNASADLQARGPRLDQKCGEAAARIVGGSGDQNEVLRDPCPGDKPLLAVHDPMIALTHRLAAHQSGIGTGTRRRFGHGEGGAATPIDERLQPTVLLVVPRDLGERDHGAVVGRGTVEDKGPEDGSSHFLIEDGAGTDGEAQAAARAWHLRGPKPLFLCFFS